MQSCIEILTVAIIPWKMTSFPSLDRRIPKKVSIRVQNRGKWSKEIEAIKNT